MAEDEKGEADPKKVDIEVSKGQDKEDLFIFPITTQTLIFQIVLAVVCCHYSMIMTNWGDPVINNSTQDFFAENSTSFWIKIIL